MPILTFIARAHDGNLLTASMEVAGAPGMNFDSYKQQAKMILGKINNRSPSKCSFESGNYTFHAPFKKYFPPLISPKSWSLRKEILNGIQDDYYTYTGDKAEGLMLKLYRLKPKVGTRRELSASAVKNDMYTAALGTESNWEKDVPEQVSEIIKDNWDIVTNFATSEDHTMRVAGMKFPKEGYNSK